MGCYVFGKRGLHTPKVGLYFLFLHARFRVLGIRDGAFSWGCSKHKRDVTHACKVINSVTIVTQICLDMPRYAYICLELLRTAQQQLYTAGLLTWHIWYRRTCHMVLDVTLTPHRPRTHVGVCCVHACLITPLEGPRTVLNCYRTVFEQSYTADVARWHIRFSVA